MYDASDRFLHQLAADRRASLLRPGRASSKRSFRRALGAVLACLGLVADRDRGESASLDRSRTAPSKSELHMPLGLLTTDIRGSRMSSNEGGSS